MAEIEVGFSSVFRYVNFSVLEGRHRAWVYIEIGIKFLHCDFEAAFLEDGSNCRRGNALA